MEIQRLKITLSDADLNHLVQTFMPKDQPVENIKIGVTPAGVTVSGVYPLFIDVHFETLWEPIFQDEQVVIRLANMKAMGVPVNIFKSAVIKVLEEQVKKEPGLSMKGDAIAVHVDHFLKRIGIPVMAQEPRISCGDGVIGLEIGADSK